MTKNILIRCIYIKEPAFTETGLAITLEDDERIANVDHKGGNVWIYIEKSLNNI